MFTKESLAVWSDPALGTRNWNKWRNVLTISSPEASGAAAGSQVHSLFSQTSISVWTALPPKGPCKHSSSLCKSKTTVRTLALQRSNGGEKKRGSLRSSHPTIVFTVVFPVKPPTTERVYVHAGPDRLEVGWERPAGRVPGQCLEWEVEHRLEGPDGKSTSVMVFCSNKTIVQSVCNMQRSHLWWVRDIEECKTWFSRHDLSEAGIKNLSTFQHKRMKMEIHTGYLLLSFNLLILFVLLPFKASNSLISMVIKGSSCLYLTGADCNHTDQLYTRLGPSEREKLLQDSVQVAKTLCRQRVLEWLESADMPPG